MKEFQVGDDVQLRDGREARVLAVHPEQERALIVEYRSVSNREWVAGLRRSNGMDETFRTSALDLIHKPKVVTFERWVNVYPGGVWDTFRSKESADRCAQKTRLGPAEKITITREVGGDQEGSL